MADSAGEAARRKLVTLIIPAYNEEDNVGRLKPALDAALAGQPYDFEFLAVDNCSTDRTGEMLKALCAGDPRWRYLRLSRNFSVEMSMTAGYHYARGDGIIVLYSDLQDPPEVIPELLAKWDEGWDIVYGVRTERPGDAAWRNALVHVAYNVIHWLSDVPIPKHAGDFRLIDRRVRDALLQCPEYNRYLRGLISWLGFRQVAVEYARKPRIAGKSKAPTLDLLFFLFGAISSFSLKPLRLFTLLGFSVLGLCLLALPFYLIGYLVGSPPAGVTTIILLLLIGIGLNSLGIGVLGEYLGRTYLEVKRRPLFLVAEAMNLELPPTIHP